MTRSAEPRGTSEKASDTQDRSVAAASGPELLGRVVSLLFGHGVDTWVFGGWAEEIRALSQPREHRDIDLLYPAHDFGRVDALFRQGALREIAGKRFPHKRAFELDGVMVELLLVRRDGARLYTDFWAAVRHVWPDDTLSTARGLRVASEAALRGFRAKRT